MQMSVSQEWFASPFTTTWSLTRSFAPWTWLQRCLAQLASNSREKLLEAGKSCWRLVPPSFQKKKFRKKKGFQTREAADTFGVPRRDSKSLLEKLFRLVREKPVNQEFLEEAKLQCKKTGPLPKTRPSKTRMSRRVFPADCLASICLTLFLPLLVLKGIDFTTGNLVFHIFSSGLKPMEEKLRRVPPGFPDLESLFWGTLKGGSFNGNHR